MKLRSIHLCETALALACATSAMAQEAPPPAQTATPGRGLEEIIVTARRVEENQQRVPVAVTTLTPSAIERRNINAVNDIQFNVPNLQIKPSNIQPSRPEFIIRGQR